MRTLPNSARYTGLGVIFVCLMTITLPGCGRKMFPKPPAGEAPPQVKDLSAQVMPRSVELSWTPAAGVSGKGVRYSIMRSELKWENRDCLECPTADQREVQSIDASAAKAPMTDGKLRWTDTGVSYRRAFRYQISIIDEKGNPLSVSNPAIAKVYPGPAAPVSLSAATQPQGILINWKSVSRDIEGNNLKGDLSFRVERRSGDKNWEKASPTLVKGNSFLDQSVAAEHGYNYRIVPVLTIDNTNVFGEPSSPVMAKAPESVPPPPPASVWVVPAHGALEVRWTESEGKNGGYHVYRREGKEIIRLTSSPIQHPPFVDQGAKKNATYFYAVSAISAGPDHKEGLLSKWAEMRNLLTE